MSKLIFGDLLSIDEGIILHQVNSKGTMQKGLGALLNKKYQNLEAKTKEHISRVGAYVEYNLLGTVHFHLVTPGDNSLEIANCFSEIGMCSDRNPGDPANTSYDAMIKCFDQVKDSISTNGPRAYVPFGMGCGLAGGDWNIVSAILKNYDFTIVARPADYELWINK